MGGGGGGGGGIRGVRVIVNGEVKFFVEIQKKKYFFLGGGVGRGWGGGSSRGWGSGRGCIIITIITRIVFLQKTDVSPLFVV